VARRRHTLSPPSEATRAPKEASSHSFGHHEDANEAQRPSDQLGHMVRNPDAEGRASEASAEGVGVNHREVIHDERDDTKR
jgi:hypothetical protein